MWSSQKWMWHTLKTFGPNWYYFQACCHINGSSLSDSRSTVVFLEGMISACLQYPISGISALWFCLCMKTGGNLHNFGLALLQLFVHWRMEAATSEHTSTWSETQSRYNCALIPLILPRIDEEEAGPVSSPHNPTGKNQYSHCRGFLVLYLNMRLMSLLWQHL